MHKILGTPAVATVSVSGLTAIVDIGDQELNAARTQALELKIDEHRAAWLGLLRPHVLRALNDLEKEGDIPARYGFLVKVAQQHGSKILLDCALPWVTIREKPGNAVLISSAELIRRIATTPEVLLVYGAGLWEAEKRARRLFPVATDMALVIPISTEGQPDVGSYHDEDQIIEGSLEGHFRAERSYSNRGQDPNAATLLQVIIQAVAQGWGKEISGLNGTWRRAKRVLCGRFLRR